MYIGDFRRANIKYKYWENMRTIEIISDEYNKKVPCYTHAPGVLQHHSI
jgi:hypothetical protein